MEQGQAGPHLAQVIQSLDQFTQHSLENPFPVSLPAGEGFPVQALSCWINNSQREAGHSDLHLSHISKIQELLQE